MYLVWFIIISLVALASYKANQNTPCYICHYSNIECHCQNNSFTGCSVLCAVGDIGRSTQQNNGCPNRLEGLVLDSFSRC